MKKNDDNLKIGYIGLGKMGKNMVLRLLEHGVGVVVWNRTAEKADEVTRSGAIKASSIKDLIDRLDPPRTIWLMLSQGEPTTLVLTELEKFLSKGDLVIDGGNAYYQDSVMRAKKLAKMGVNFMDVGVSGGPSGARNGACLMVGGKREDFEKNQKLLEIIAAKGAYGYFGEAGAGHFAKMVHNGIEYGMMESIAEGAAVLKTSRYNFNLAAVFSVYNNRSVIESRLVGWAQEALTENSGLKKISSKIDHTGEGEWTLREAKKLKVPTPVIAEAFKVRLNSAKDNPESPDGFRNKVVSALRGKFGQHEVKA